MSLSPFPLCHAVHLQLRALPLMTSVPGWGGLDSENANNSTGEVAYSDTGYSDTV